MTVLVKLPVQLQPSAGGAREAKVEGNTVADALESLFETYPELRERISDGDGALRRFVNVYLSGEDIRFLEGTATPISDGAELTILPAVAGG
jgi:molybdopterin converting factor small subunit